MPPSTLQEKYPLDTSNALVLHDDHTALFSRSITCVLKRWPDHFESDISQEFHRFIGQLENAFKRPRHICHLTRLFCSHYLMRKSLNQHLHLSPRKRGLKIRLINTLLQFPFRVQSTLGIIVTISLHEENERFGERHMASAILSIVPGVEIVKRSFYACHSNLDPIHTFYLEVIKKDGTEFSLSEKKMLKQLLPTQLAKRVETLDSATFNLHREEEILKHIALLKRELISTPDLPQVMIFFAAQDLQHLSFNVILLRTLKKNTPLLHRCFATLPVQFIPDRTKLFHDVEANVFQLRMSIEASLLRTDFSINLYQARYLVLSLLHKAIGEVRDYNGGLFALEHNQFAGFKNAFSEIAQKDPDLLENFFHAISPTHMQTILHLDILKALFQLFLQASEARFSKKADYFLKSQNDGFFLLTMIRADDPSLLEHVTKALKNEPHLQDDLSSATLIHRDSHFLGFVYSSHDKANRNKCKQVIKQGVRGWSDRVNSFQSLRLSVQTFPRFLDPCFGGDEVSRKILKLLFEGLTRIGKDEKPENALAEKIEISSDGQRYVFTLKDALWSNKDKITAHDFAYAWKKVLSPNFSTAFTHLFYPIKNARAVKEGKVDIKDVGIHVLDNNTLEVELEHPCPYFLELTAHSLYSPVNARIDILHPQWSSQEGAAYVCNGPFQLKKEQNEGRELIKNPLYWDSKQIQLNEILIIQANATAACHMFKKGEIDWLGRPMQIWHPLFHTASTQKVQMLPGLSVYWAVFNVQCFPFHNLKIRQALAFALQRQNLIDALHYPASPAYNPLPCDQRQHFNMTEENIKKSRLLLEEGLEEINLQRAQLPPLTLIYNRNELRKKTAMEMSAQWEKTLKIQCVIESCEWQDLFQRLSIGNFQIGLINWRSAIDDPIYTLNTFRYPNEKINFAKWENADYQALLQKADQELDLEKRRTFLAAAEKILIQEMPVIPLFDELNPCIKKKNLAGIIPTRCSNIDFRYAYFIKKPTTKR